MRWLAATLLLALASEASAQYTIAPGNCSAGQYLAYTSSGAWSCTAPTGAGVPSAMIAFTAGACPAGWSEYTAARGFAIVGLQSGGTAAGTVGTALTNLQDKSVTPTFAGDAFTGVINHTHPVTDPGHTHLTQRYPTTTGGSSGFTVDTSMSGTLADNTLPTKTNTTGVTTTNPAGGVASITPSGTVSAVTTSSVMAYIQLRACSKD